MGQASAFFSPSQVEIEVEAARKSGILKAKECDRILDLNASAVKEGVPLLVQIGTTGWFAIRESSFRRSVVGGWAHVKCDGLEGMGPQRIRRRGTMRPIMCKVRDVSRYPRAPGREAATMYPRDEAKIASCTSRRLSRGRSRTLSTRRRRMTWKWRVLLEMLKRGFWRASQ